MGHKIHDLAQCMGCDWELDCFHHRGNISYACQKHANKCGSKVLRETGHAFDYDPSPRSL